MRNSTNKCVCVYMCICVYIYMYIYIYINLLYYKHRCLLYVSVTRCGHLLGGVLWKIYYIERQNNLTLRLLMSYIYIYIWSTHS